MLVKAGSRLRKEKHGNVVSQFPMPLGVLKAQACSPRSKPPHLQGKSDPPALEVGLPAGLAGWAPELTRIFGPAPLRWGRAGKNHLELSGDLSSFTSLGFRQRAKLWSGS